MPHLLILNFAPELWWLLVPIFLMALLVGWLRIMSGSMLGPWLIHASANDTMALLVASRTAG